MSALVRNGAPRLELSVTEQVADVLVDNGFAELDLADIVRLHFALCNVVYDMELAVR